MSKQISMNDLQAKGLGETLKNKILIESLISLLVDKGVINLEELDQKYDEMYEENSIKYIADTLSMSKEEYLKLIGENEE